MKIKKILYWGLLCLFSAVFADEKDYPFGTVILNGGRIEPVSMSLIESTNEHLNFCFAQNFSDGSIYLRHSGGIHTVSEYGCRDYSLDNGVTWQRGQKGCLGGFNAYETLDGKKCQIECWDNKVSDIHTLIHKTADKNHIGQVTKSTIKLPYKSSFRLHRKVLRTKDNRLLLTGYGYKENANKNHSFLIESTDDGKSWHYYSTILEDYSVQFTEGPNEADVVELTNGDFLAFVRLTALGDLVQLRSRDGGKTWGERKNIAPFCVAPMAHVMKNGTVLIVSGRPALYLLIDFTGTGNNYQTYQVYGGSGSSYASILETAKDQITVVYDESDIGAWKNLARFSRIFAARFNVIKDDKLLASNATHPKAKEYQVFYSPDCGMAIEKRTNFFSHGLLHRSNEKAAQNNTWWEIQKIAERPYPVLHLELKGEARPYRFANYRTNLQGVEPYSKVKIGWELRVNDHGTDAPQFQVLCSFAQTSSFAVVEFTKNKILLKSNNQPIEIPYDLHGKFKAFELHADANNATWKLVDGTGKLISEGKLNPNKNHFDNRIQFGDGSNGVAGSVDLSYIGYDLQK